MGIVHGRPGSRCAGRSPGNGRSRHRFGQHAVFLRADFGREAYFRGSRPHPQGRVGIGVATKAGDSLQKNGPNPSPGRPCPVEMQVDRTPGRPSAIRGLDAIQMYTMQVVTRTPATSSTMC